MSIVNRRFEDEFLAHYTNASPVVAAKASVLLWINLTILPVLLVHMPIAELVLTADRFAAVVESIWAVAIVAALVWLRRGRYQYASNITIVSMLVSLASIGYSGSTGGPLFKLTQLGFLMCPGIVYAGLVATDKRAPLRATAFSLVVLGGFFVLRLVPEMPGGAGRHEFSWFMSMAFMLVILGIMGYRASSVYFEALSGFAEKAQQARDYAEEIRRAEVRFRTIFNSVGEAVFIHDAATGAILDVNEKMTDLFGCTAVEAATMGLGSFSSGMPPYTQKDADVWLAKARAGEMPVVEWRAKTTSGKVFWSELCMRTAEIDGQQRIIVTMRDIEARKRDEEQRALLEQRLRQAEKMDAIGHLAGGIAHDFNNQLTGILGYAELLLRSEDPLQRTYAENVAKAARRSADLTRQLLAFARKGKYQIVSVDVHALIREVVALLSRSIDKRISLRTDLRVDCAQVAGDPTQLQNALLNLAINARDAMPEGGELAFETQKVTFSEQDSKAFESLAPGPFLRVRVSDNGAGMSKETLEHMFEPFFTTKEYGTGMGLAAVYGTVKSHHGAIDVSSEVGRGSVFQLYLPMADRALAPAVEHEQEMSHPIGGARLLVIDDELVVRQLVADMLSAAGCAVTVCDDGTEAVRIYRERWPEIDVVILDMMMPRQSGRDVFHWLRNINPRAKVLIASGFSLDGDPQNLFDLGVAGFLEKPFRMAELLAKVRACLPG